MSFEREKPLNAVSKHINCSNIHTRRDKVKQINCHHKKKNENELLHSDLAIDILIC